MPTRALVMIVLTDDLSRNIYIYALPAFPLSGFTRFVSFEDIEAVASELRALTSATVRSWSHGVPLGHELRATRTSRSGATSALFLSEWCTGQGTQTFDRFIRREPTQYQPDAGDVKDCPIADDAVDDRHPSQRQIAFGDDLG